MTPKNICAAVSNDNWKLFEYEKSEGRALLGAAVWLAAVERKEKSVITAGVTEED